MVVSIINFPCNFLCENERNESVKDTLTKRREKCFFIACIDLMLNETSTDEYSILSN